MKNVIRNHTAQQNALSTLQNAQTAEGNALQAKTQADYTRDSIALQKEGYKMSQKWNNVNFGINMGKVGIDLGTSIASMIVTADQSSASSELNEMAEEGERLVDESVASGDTYYGENSETGEIELVMSPKVTDWYNSSRQKIEDSNHLTSTKKSLLQSLDYTYENLQTSANKSTVQKYYSNLNTNFQTSLSSAKRTDTESYVAAGGNRDLWNQSATIEGISVIYGRNDWSAETKAAQTTDYLLSVISDGDTMIASDYARTQGLQAAYNYIQGLTGYTETEKQKMYSTASNAVTQATSAATETAEAYMTDALVNGSAKPEEVYTAVATEYAGASPAIYNAAINAAKSKQISVATTAYQNQLTADKSSGLFALYQTYSAMQAGSWDDLFYNISDVKTEALSSYETAIKTMEEKYGEEIDDANADLFSAYETKHNTNLTQYNEGQINGQQYVANEISFANAFYEGVQGEDSDKSLWNSKVDAMATEAINAIIDNNIPERYRSAFSEAFTTVKIAMGVNLTSSKMTQEAQEQIYDMNLEFTGKVASYLQSYDIEKEGVMSLDDFKKYVTEAAQDYILLRQSSGYTNLMEGKYNDEKYMSGKLKDFANALKLAYGYDTGDVFVKLGTDIATGNSRYMFANDTVTETWEGLSTMAKTQVSWLTGYDAKDMTTVCVLDDNGAPILAPQVNVNGECYRFKDGTIQICTDGKTWLETGIKTATTAEAMAKNKSKSSVYSAVQQRKTTSSANEETPATGTPEETTPTVDTWAKSNPQPTTQSLYNYLSEVEDIDSTATKLKELGKNGTITIPTPGTTTADECIDNIVRSIKRNRGEGSDTAVEESPSEEAPQQTETSRNEVPTSHDETPKKNPNSDAAAYAKEHPKASVADVKNFLGKIEDEDEFEKAVTDFLDAAKNDNFLNEKTAGNAEVYINYSANEIRKKRGWN